MPGPATTQPSAHTDYDSGRGRPRAVRWIFPAALVTPLAGLHVVGRDDDCDTVLAGNEISRRHAEFRVDGPIAAVRDLQSRNGVFVNGARRPDAPLGTGDVVRCGEWIGIVSASAPDSAGFREIAPGWFGGAVLAEAAEPARRLTAELPVIVQGETGTGKEGMARAIHAWSGRSGPFVPVNCAALPGELAEAELFGYRKGAFTGAEAASTGLFRAANGGTLFLDEILDLPAALQPKLLRVLEDRQVRGLGETRETPVDVRIVAATQEPLAQAVVDRRFRADLQARLDGLTVVLPPLRARREDIVPLFLAFLRQHAGGQPPLLEPKLVEALCLYDWPLNVRELTLLARRLLGVHGTELVLKKTFLPERMLRRAPEAATAATDVAAAGSGKQPRRSTDDESEFEALIEALRAHGGSVAKAAAAIGVNRARAYRLLSAHPEFSLDDLRG
jgi:transcriptional regulator with AAA-type ATPase domain